MHSTGTMLQEQVRMHSVYSQFFILNREVQWSGRHGAGTMLQQEMHRAYSQSIILEILPERGRSSCVASTARAPCCRNR